MLMVGFQWLEGKIERGNQWVFTAKCEALVSSCCLTKFLSKSEGTLNDGSFTRNAGGMKATGAFLGRGLTLRSPHRDPDPLWWLSIASDWWNLCNWWNRHSRWVKLKFQLAGDMMWYDVICPLPAPSNWDSSGPHSNLGFTSKLLRGP